MKLSSSFSYFIFSYFIFFKEISFFKSEFVQLIPIIKSETPTLPPHLSNNYISLVSRTIHFNLHPLLSLLASFLKIFWQPFWSIMVNSQRLRIDTCYFYLGKLIHSKIKMILAIDYLSFAYLEYLCDIE